MPMDTFVVMLLHTHSGFCDKLQALQLGGHKPGEAFCLSLSRA